MTHTLHRRGTPENLAHDFVIHSMPARGFNHEGARPKLQKFLEIVRRHGAVNCGDGKRGNQYYIEPDDMYDNLATITHAVFTDEEALAAALKELKEADVGMSITTSGLLEKLFACCDKAGIKPFAMEHSLGVLGNTERLPDDEVMQITTMCGHAMVSQGLVRRLIRKIKKGEMTPAEAGIELAKPCQCGIFNPVRAAELIEEYCALYCVSEK
ncbi:MAG: hypothetical protein P4N59_12105 [Negativicutes bacterium]|nr:hypothetical protein [Negativicutes bacterium]